MSRYDRELSAKAFTNNVESMFDDVTKTAGPTTQNMIDKVVAPFLRRSAVTIMAGINSAADDLTSGTNDTSSTNDLSNATNMNGSVSVQTNNNNKLGTVISNAMKAVDDAGKYVDQLELEEKSQELENRYVLFSFLVHVAYTSFIARYCILRYILNLCLVLVFSNYLYDIPLLSICKTSSQKIMYNPKHFDSQSKEESRGSR